MTKTRKSNDNDESRAEALRLAIEAWDAMRWRGDDHLAWLEQRAYLAAEYARRVASPSTIDGQRPEQAWSDLIAHDSSLAHLRPALTERQIADHLHYQVRIHRQRRAEALEGRAGPRGTLPDLELDLLVRRARQNGVGTRELARTMLKMGFTAAGFQRTRRVRWHAPQREVEILEDTLGKRWRDLRKKTPTSSSKTSAVR